MLLMAATLLGLSSSVTAQWAAPWGELHEEGVTTSPELDALLTRLFAGAPGAAGLAVSGNGRAARFGVRNEFPFDQMVPIGSGSRWLVAATVLALVERGKLDLDASLARWLGEFDRPDKRQITLRQCLSCTAGFPRRVPAAESRLLGWDEVTALLARCPLRARPGAEFHSSDIGFQVAAAAAVRVTGREWPVLFQALIAEPLGLYATEFHGLWPNGTLRDATIVPWVGRAAATSLQDFEKFVRMLAQQGEVDSVRVLQRRSVQEMFRSQVEISMTVRNPDLGGGDFAYGLGCWLAEVDGGWRAATANGTFLAWVDPDLEIAGVLLCSSGAARALPKVEALGRHMRDYWSSPPVAGRSERVHLVHDGRQRRYLLRVPPGAEQVLQVPLLLLLHDAGSSGEEIAAITRFAELADAHGFVLACPDGTGLSRRSLAWNAAGVAGRGRDGRADDVGYLQTVIDNVKQRVPVDPERIYAVGLGQGATLCHRLAREAGGLLAAIAAVGGGLPGPMGQGGGRVGVMLVRGRPDAEALGRARRPDRASPAVGDPVAYYRLRNGCHQDPEIDRADGVRIETWESAHAWRGVGKLRVVRLPRTLEAWPGGRSVRRGAGNVPVVDWDASDAIWDFCSDLRRARTRAPQTRR